MTSSFEIPEEERRQLGYLTRTCAMLRGTPRHDLAIQHEIPVGELREIQSRKRLASTATLTTIFASLGWTLEEARVFNRELDVFGQKLFSLPLEEQFALWQEIFRRIQSELGSPPEE